MHGRKRAPVGQTTDGAKDQTASKNLSLLLAEVLKNHHARCYTKEALKQSARLLELNPEVYTAWNYRKLAVRHLMNAEPEKAARKLLTDEELRLVERALRVNVKSYGAWYHRKWIIDLGLSPLDHEFLLLMKLLKDDSRNFHGWGYRRFAVKAKEIHPEKELDYTTEKINENFSNYSAWHYRSTLLAELVKGEVSKKNALNNEYKLVNQAYFTEPDDQSAWFYNSWLLGETKTNLGACVIGTWPIDGSTVQVDSRGPLSLAVKYKSPLNFEHMFKSRGLPLVVSFNEAIEDVHVVVRSKPEFLHSDDVQWRSLSGAQRPSKTWLAEILLEDCPEMEFSLSLDISTSGSSQEANINFKLQVTSNHFSDEDLGLNSKSQTNHRAFSWPGESGKREKEAKLILEHETGPGGKSLSEVPSFMKLVPEEHGTTVGELDWRKEMLEGQIEKLRELLELEGNSKWAILTLARVLMAHNAQTQCHEQSTDEVLKLYERLWAIDPIHHDYYRTLHSILHVEKVVGNPESLKHLWWVPELDPGMISKLIGWLSWNGKSLSTFRSFGRLLWVQQLDLSHNQLCSVDGLEAMQLLVALDISHNLIANVTALSSLQFLSRLQFLSISHNEIGGHPVDSSRYSFPSLLTNQLLKDSNVESNFDAGDQWEVMAVFGGLGLKVIEIAGNPAAHSKFFRDALVKALPSLELLDKDEVQQAS